ncbi:MAG: hypothetical protein U0794_20745 [Isosphaeraceae bacterium]
MKRYLKRPVKAVWRWLAPIRRPIMAKIEATLVRCCNQPRALGTPEEAQVLMDHLVRELVRLQKQVDMLQAAIEDLAPASKGLSIVGSDRVESSEPHSAAG